MSEKTKPQGMADPAWMVRVTSADFRRTLEMYCSGRLLDIGCGDGNKRPLVEPYVQTYVGLDHEGTLHGLNKVDIVASPRDIPEPDSSFNSVLCTSVLEHLEEPKAAVAEAFRVLRPGGHAVYSAPLFWHIHEAPRDFFQFTSYGLRYMFEQAGFEVVELQAQSGFFVTFGSELSYYVQRFRRGPLKPLVTAGVVFNNWFFPKLDRPKKLRDERFTWNYRLVARKPDAAPAA